ncbi:ATP synthase F0 subunit 8 [Ascochyta clinopodiicola]|nr:ATP synthase F0 subunit 8 [Ascochyta clinopodiicola]
MNTTRFLRPFARAAFRAPTAVRPAVMARPALASQQQKKTPEVGAQQMVRTADNTAQKHPPTNSTQTILKSAMPQLIPFFFVNETTVAFVLLPTLIYIFSKYILPQRVRLFAARLFISKL